MIWQGSIDLVMSVCVLMHGKPGLEQDRSIVHRRVLKTAVLLLMLLPIFAIPHPSTTSPPLQAAVPGPYEQPLDVALRLLGAPNKTLPIMNLYLLHGRHLQDNNSACASVAAVLVNH